MGIRDIEGLIGIGAKNILLAALAVGAVVLFATGTAGAQNTISSCQEINATNDGGGLVELDGDIGPTSGDCIEVNTSDVVFDGLGNTITGPGSSGIGIEVNATSAGGGATNVTVKDVKVEDFSKGIQYNDNGPGAGGEITNVNVTGNTYGLFALGTVPVDVTNSELVYNGDGAQAYFTGRFEGNEISNNTDRGLNLLTTTEIVNNDIKNNGGRGIHLGGGATDTEIVGNDVVNNDEAGVYVEVDGVIVENNLVTDNNQAGGGAGISVEAASNVEITNNRVHRNRDYGVLTDNAPGLLVQDNRITENCGGQAGLYIRGDLTGVTVESNNVSNNTGDGMILDGGAVAERGEITVAATPSTLTVRDIEANDNGGWGVGVNQPDAVLDGITAVGNDQTGIDLGPASVGVTIKNSEIRENGFGAPAATTGINVRVGVSDVAIIDTVVSDNDMDIQAQDKNTTLENVDLGSATVSGTATEVDINGTPVSVPSGPSGVQNFGGQFEATGSGYFDATVGYNAGAEQSTLALWKNNGSWNELGGTVGANGVSYNITSFSTFGVYGQDDSGGGGGNVPPTAEFDVSDDPTAGQTLTLDASSSEDPDGSIDEYIWTIDDTSSNKYGEEINHTFAEEGLYKVELTVGDTEGGKDSTEAIVDVAEESDTDVSQNGTQDGDEGGSEQEDEDSDTQAQDSTGGASDEESPDGFDIPSGDLNVGDELTLEAGDVGLEGEITSYEWAVDGEQVGTDEVVDHVLDSSGTVNVRLTVSNDTTTRTFSRNVSVSDVEQEADGEETDGEQQMDEETEQQTEENETDENETDDEDGEGLPGFTSVVALVALVLVAYRRT